MRLAIKQARPTSQASGGSVPGETVAGDGLLVATADRVIEIVRLQPAGKREMSGEEFLRGHQIRPGKQLAAVDLTASIATCRGCARADCGLHSQSLVRRSRN